MFWVFNRHNQSNFKNMNKIIYYLPRYLAILFIVFVSIFAFDVFEMGGSSWQKIGGFLIHLIPSFLLLIALFVAWKKELIGGILFIILGILVVFRTNSILSALPIIIPSLIIGILFLIGWKWKKK